MIHKFLADKKVVLASASPRRQELFRLIGLNPLVVPAHIHEPITTAAPSRQVMTHAKNKVRAIAKLMDPETIVVGADTLVVLDGRILGKPETQEQASEYLTLLSGRTHAVYTGVCVNWRGQILCRSARSLVTFKELSLQEIAEYLKTSEPMDKAGAYGIQGYGSQFITSIKGCYFNVMGFPINLFYNMITDMFLSYTS